MKFCSVIVSACLAAPFPVRAQQGSAPPQAPNAQQQLPSAPSASLPKPQPAPKPATAGGTAPSPTPAPAEAQPAAAGTSSSEAPVNTDQLTTIKRSVNEVGVFFTVTDKHGHYVRNLTAEDIKVLDDNKPPQAVRSFQSQTDLPLRLGLLIDESNSIRERFTFEQQAAIEFMNQVIRRGQDEAFVLGFDTTADLAQDFTDNPELLGKAVRSFRPGGGTALFDAVYYACRDKLMNPPTKGPVRKAIILLSDGDDNQSRVSREEAIEMAQRAEVIVYAISTNVSGMLLPGDKVLQRIADATGGRAFFPFKLDDIASRFGDIQDELRSQYAIFYKPADFAANGQYRSIALLADNKKYHVRAKKGYYAPATQ
ncbi:MAG: VWA domain-containing protein [Acidobacteria bacterium]|nr:VWA domain-containing protein [Acidobacteriota bacterium]